MLRKYNKTLTVALTAIALATASLAASSDAFAGGGGKGGGGGGGKGGGGGWGHHHHHGFGGFYSRGGGTCWLWVRATLVNIRYCSCASWNTRPMSLYSGGCFMRIWPTSVR